MFVPSISQADSFSVIAGEQCRKVCLSSCDQPVRLGLLAPDCPGCLQEKLDFQDGDANVSHLRAPGGVTEPHIAIKALGNVNGNTAGILASLAALQPGNGATWEVNNAKNHMIHHLFTQVRRAEQQKMGQSPETNPGGGTVPDT